MEMPSNVVCNLQQEIKHFYELKFQFPLVYQELFSCHPNATNWYCHCTIMVFFFGMLGLVAASLELPKKDFC